MRDKILPWKVKEGRMKSAFKDGTPQEIIDLEKEYNKRVSEELTIPNYNFIVREK